MAEVPMDCGHAALYCRPAPEPGDWLWCTRCDTGVRVIGRESRIANRESRQITRLPLGRRRASGLPAKARATDWAAGPQAVVVLACGHVRFYRPPSPARGDEITCGCCGRPTLVLLPQRRAKRHAPRLTHADIYGAAS